MMNGKNHAMPLRPLAIEIRERMATKTIAERLEQMLPLYEAMNAEVNMLIDEYVDEVVAPRCPGVPRGVLRALEVDQRVGTALNFAEALRFLRHARA